MLWTKVETSPILYANLGKTGVKRSSLAFLTSCPSTLGPGSYDAPVPKDVRVSLTLNQNQLSRCAFLQLIIDAPATWQFTPTIISSDGAAAVWRQEHQDW